MVNNLTGSLVIRLDYKIDPEDRVVSMSHPSLNGVLGFEFTTLNLAEVQLKALREDKEKTVIEGLAEDTVALVSAFKDLKNTVKDFNK